MGGKEAESKKQRASWTSRLGSLALLILAGYVVVRLIVPQTVGEQARRHFESVLQKHYADFQVSIGKGHYEPNRGLVFEDLVISDPTPNADSSSWSISGWRSREAVRIDKLIVLAKTEPAHLLEKRNPLVTEQVILDGVFIDTWLDKSGQISTMGLWPLPKMGPAAPRIEIRRGRIRYTPSTSSVRPLELDLSELVLLKKTVEPDPRTQPRASLPDIRASQPQASSVVQTISLRGGAPFANRIELVGEISQAGISLRGELQKARFDKSLVDCLPNELHSTFQDVRGLECTGDIAFSFAKPRDQPTRYQVKANIHDGRYQHPRLPEAVTSLRGVVLCEPNGVQITTSQAKWGDALIRLSGKVDQYQWPHKASFNVSMAGLSIEERLRRVLPESMRPVWERFQPRGRVDVANASLKHQENRWIVDADLKCLGVDVVYEKFPYPIKQLVGHIQIRDGIARCDRLDGRIGGQKLAMKFIAPTRPEIAQDREVSLSVGGPVAIDETLVRALSHRGAPKSSLESFVRSLQPRGSVQLVSANIATDSNGKKTQTISLKVADGHLRYEKFAYPLYNVRGDIQIQDDFVFIHRFHGTNANAGQIQCDGSYHIRPTSASSAAAQSLPREPQLKLRFHANRVPMDEALRSSLPDHARHVWESISPSGVLDELEVVVNQTNKNEPIKLAFNAVESESQRLTNRTLSIQPSCVPYRLDISNGHVHFDGKRVIIHAIRAHHGATRISASGDCYPTQDGRWRLALDIHSGSRVATDPELIRTLPSEMRTAMNRLQLRRPVSIRGQTGVLFSGTSTVTPEFDWAVVLQLEGNRIGDVGPVHSLRGEVLARGTRDQSGIQADGEIRIDSMHMNDLQITGVRGPFSIDGSKLTLGAKPGRQATPPISLGSPVQQVGFQSSTKSRHIKGRMFEGDVTLSGEVELSSGSFDVDMSMLNGHVPILLADLGQGQSELTGRISGQAELEGILGTFELLRGVGSARVSDANVYQLPLLVQLLNLLRIKPTEDVAFTDADVEYTIVEDEITFNDLKLWGDLVALRGGGTMNRRGDLDLSFDTQVSPKHEFTRVLPFRSQRYTLLTVDVQGSLNNPKIQRRPLDGVERTLERLLPIGISRPDDKPRAMRRR